MKAPDLGSPEFWDTLKDQPALLAHQLCSIDLSDLDAALQHHAATRAWVNAAHESAKIEEEQAKWRLTKARARAMLGAKAENDPNTGRHKTVAVLEAETDDHPDVAEAQEELFAAQEKRGALRAIADGLGDRRDMLVQLAAKARDERADYR